MHVKYFAYDNSFSTAALYATSYNNWLEFIGCKLGYNTKADVVLFWEIR